MGDRGIASILHRDTLAVLVGRKTYERGQRCFTEGRVLAVDAARGELRGRVRPNETGRAPYTCRIWLREEGVAYECTCPIGEKREFCKHVVAIALEHLERERVDAERGLPVLADALATLTHEQLVEGLLVLARRDDHVATSLKRMCLEALSRP